jgi:diguanylate cyclase (GGDEF)-like protein/PAS domain S-box-containing protein
MNTDGPGSAHEVHFGEADRLALLDLIPEMVFVLDAEGRVVYINGRATAMLGHRLDEVVGANAFDFIHPDDLAYMAWSWEARQSKPGEPGLIVQCRGRHADGSWVACEVIGLNLLEHELVRGMVITLRSLDHQAALADSPARLRSMVDRTSDIVLLLDPDGTLVYANRRLTSGFGHDNDRVVGDPWVSLLVPDDVASAERWFAELLAAGDRANARARLHIRGARGDVHELEWIGTNQTGDPLIGGVILSGRDITELVVMEGQLRAQNAQLLEAATHDPLTGLLNRPAFVQEMAGVLAARRAADDTGDVVVLFCDLDRFKAVNDAHGHATGDHVLAIVAARLADSVRDGDVLARYGGDEFTILLGDDAPPEVVTGLATRLRATLSEPVTVGDTMAHIGVTIGVSRAPVRTANLDEMLREADAAMYAEKRRHVARPD